MLLQVHPRSFVRNSVVAYASKRLVNKYASQCVPSIVKMPHIITPSILLDDSVPVERELYEAYNSHTLDAKNLLVIGHIAVASSTRHLRLDTERRDLAALKDTYDRIIEDIKRSYTEQSTTVVTRIIDDKEKDMALLKERLTADKERELAALREQFSQMREAIMASTQNAITEKERELAALRQQIAQTRESMTASSQLALSEKERELTYLREQISQLRESMTASYQMAITEKDREVASLREQIAQLRESIASSSFDVVSEKEKEIYALKEQLIKMRESTTSQTQNAIAEKDQEIMALKEQLINTRETLQSSMQIALSTKECELVELRNKLASNDEVIAYRERLTAAQQRTQELEQALHEAKQQAQASQAELIKGLRNDEIMQLQAEIAMLRGSNFSKGVVGENQVMAWLANAFPDCQIIDKTGAAAESDIHVVKPNGDFIAIECKNKNSITLQDVDKSMRDVAYLQNKYGKRFVGYVFTSLRSTNIPKKGAGYLEFFADTIPIYWFGQNTFDKEDTTMVEYCKTVWVLSATLRNIRSRYEQQDDSVEGYRKQIEEFTHLARNCIDRLSSNQKAIASLLNTAKTIQDNNNAVLQTINDYFSTHNIPTEAPVAFVCPKCAKSFNRKSDLTRHVAKCNVATES